MAPAGGHVVNLLYLHRNTISIFPSGMIINKSRQYRSKLLMSMGVGFLLCSFSMPVKSGKTTLGLGFE